VVFPMEFIMLKGMAWFWFGCQLWWTIRPKQ